MQVSTRPEAHRFTNEHQIYPGMLFGRFRLKSQAIHIARPGVSFERPLVSALNNKKNQQINFFLKFLRIPSDNITGD